MDVSRSRGRYGLERAARGAARKGVFGWRGKPGDGIAIARRAAGPFGASRKGGLRATLRATARARCTRTFVRRRVACS